MAIHSFTIIEVTNKQQTVFLFFMSKPQVINKKTTCFCYLYEMFSKTGIHIGVYNNLTALLWLQQMVNHMQYRYIPLRERMHEQGYF